MIQIRKTSNVLPFDKVGSKSDSSASQSTQSTSPFAVKPADPLKAITERRSKLTEEQKLAILQRALQPFAVEARGHLPYDISSMEEKVRKRMLDEGFSDVVANEAGEEAVDVLLSKRRVRKIRSQNKG